MDIASLDNVDAKFKWLQRLLTMLTQSPNGYSDSRQGGHEKRDNLESRQWGRKTPLDIATPDNTDTEPQWL